MADSPPSPDSIPSGLSDSSNVPPENASVASLQSEEPPIVPNRILGQYELVGILGHGGMGTVYRALHTKLDKFVALKLLTADFMRTPQSVARFEREMKAVGKIDHPFIVRAMDAGEIDGTHYLAMELVDGSDLYKIVKELGPFSVNDACKAIYQAALGLDAAHKAGLVHRDIKPSNLLLSKTGTIKILDLGLARLHDDDIPHEAITSLGQILGTPDYMAPEQWEDTHSADLRSDLYALGCTLFFLLIGRAPYSTDNNKSLTKKMAAHVSAPIPDLRSLRPDIPESVAKIYQRLMSKQPENRHGSGAELAQDLAPFVMPGPESTQADLHDASQVSLIYQTRFVSSGSGDGRSISTTIANGNTNPEIRPQKTSQVRFVGVSIAVGIVLIVAVISMLLPGREQRDTDISDVESTKPQSSNDHEASPPSSPRVVNGILWPGGDVTLTEGWQIDAGTLLSREPTIVNNLPFGLVPSPSYRVVAEFSLAKAHDAFYLMLPIGSRHAFFACSSYPDPETGRAWLGFGEIDEKRIPENSTGQNHLKFPQGTRHKLVVDVRTEDQNVQLNATLDNLPGVSWSGQLDQLSVPVSYLWPDAEIFGVGTVNSSYRVHSLRIDPLKNDD